MVARLTTYPLTCHIRKVGEIEGEVEGEGVALPRDASTRALASTAEHHVTKGERAWPPTH